MLSTVLNIPHGTHISKDGIPTVLKITPHSSHDIPHDTEHPYGTQDIPHGTEHPHSTEHPHGTAHTYRVVFLQKSGNPLNITTQIL